MKIRTLLGYLFGSRDAIHTIASTPAALFLGAILVLSAAFAREYDAKDLLSEPGWLAVPWLASLLTSFLLYGLVQLVGLAKAPDARPFWSGYRQFLQLYWMTAPLAWLYAIPVERFLTEGGATLANVWILALVSFWRVTLMIRVAVVYFGATLAAALFIVLLFADTVAQVALSFVPVPVINVMGGVPLSQGEAVIQDVAIIVRLLGGLSWFVWLIGTIAVAVSGAEWQPQSAASPRGRVSLPLWCLAVGSLGFWFLFLPYTQSEQQLRRQVETVLEQNRISEALKQMSSHEPSDFPPHWTPPPWLAYQNPTPPLERVLKVLREEPVSPWVLHAFLAKLTRQMDREWTFTMEWNYRFDDVAKQTLIEEFARLPKTDEYQKLYLELSKFEKNPELKQKLQQLASPKTTTEPTAETNEPK